MWQDALLRYLPVLIASAGMQRCLPIYFFCDLFPLDFSPDTRSDPTPARPAKLLYWFHREARCLPSVVDNLSVRSQQIIHLWVFLICHQYIPLNSWRCNSSCCCRTATKRGYDYGLVSRGYSYC